MPHLTNVFVSLAAPDLQAEQQAVANALQEFARTRFAGIQMLDNRAATQSSHAEIDRSHAFIGIIGASSSAPAFIAEQARAKEKGLPRFTYIKDQSPQAEAPFVVTLKNETRQTAYSSPGDLAARLRDDVHSWLAEEYLPPLFTQAIEKKLPQAEAQAVLDAIKDQSLLSASWRNQLTTAGFKLPAQQGRRNWIAHFGMRVFAHTGKTLIAAIIAVGAFVLLVTRSGNEGLTKITPTPSPTEIAQNAPPPIATPLTTPPMLPSPVTTPSLAPTRNPTPKPTSTVVANPTPSETPRLRPTATPTPPPTPTPTPRPTPTPTPMPTPSPTPRPTSTPAPTPTARAAGLSISPRNLHFMEPSTQTVTVANYDFARVDIKKVSVVSSNSKWFSIAANNCRTLKKNDSCTVVIRYAPPAGTNQASSVAISIESTTYQ